MRRQVWSLKLGDVFSTPTESGYISGLTVMHVHTYNGMTAVWCCDGRTSENSVHVLPARDLCNVENE